MYKLHLVYLLLARELWFEWPEACLLAKRNWHWEAAMAIGRLILGLRHSIMSSVMVLLVLIMMSMWGRWIYHWLISSCCQWLH